MLNTKFLATLAACCLLASCGGGGSDDTQPPLSNTLPIADAGTDLTVLEGDMVTLDGSGSSDPDGTIVSFAWTQTSGPEIQLGDTDGAILTFQAPATDATSALDFALSVVDDLGASATTQIDVMVSQSPLRVLTQEGFVEGISIGDEVTVFQGVPFAAPPVDDLRWRPPAPPAQRSGLLRTQQFAPACYQPVGGTVTSFDPSDNMSEDCLYLNIFTPQARETAGLPVMVWIHGGGNLQGSAAAPTFDGQYFARADVVLVSIQYRLGVMGYLAHPELSAENPQNISGNYGTRDIIAALEWVRNNIRSFGGDPDRVTIFGESAGAVNSCAMLISPQAEGLFQGAIMQSGFCAKQIVDLRIDDPDLGVSAESTGVESAAALGCGSAMSQVQCLRELTPETIYTTLQPADAFFNSGDGARFGLISDGVVVPAAPFTVIESGQINRVPVITGSTENEAGFWRPAIAALIPSVAAYQLILEALYDNDDDLILNGPAAEVLAAYPASTRLEAISMFEKAFSESVFTCASRREARAFASLGMPTWRYEFRHLTPGLEALGAFHASEIPYVFGVLDVDDTADGAALSDSMMQYWIDFATSGNPNGTGSEIFWPPYLTASDEHMNLSIPLGSGAALDEAECDLWDTIQVTSAVGALTD
ncbi:MAG: carboxylesterase family protein [Halioglobus sp.]